MHVDPILLTFSSAQKTKDSKEFCFAVLRQYTSKFVFYALAWTI